MGEFEKFLRSFPGMSAKTIVAIVEYVEGIEREDVDAVEVHHARVPVDRVEAFGLTVEIDASGNAVRVEFPHGGTAVAA